MQNSSWFQLLTCEDLLLLCFYNSGNRILLGFGPFVGQNQKFKDITLNSRNL